MTTPFLHQLEAASTIAKPRYLGGMGGRCLLADEMGLEKLSVPSSRPSRWTPSPCASSAPQGFGTTGLARRPSTSACGRRYWRARRPPRTGHLSDSPPTPQCK